MPDGLRVPPDFRAKAGAQAPIPDRGIQRQAAGERARPASATDRRAASVRFVWIRQAVRNQTTPAPPDRLYG